MAKYLIRLDDACPTMNHANWERIFSILKSHDLKVLIGVIPDNHDDRTMPCSPDNHFWQRMDALESEGHVIALHGYDHLCVTDKGGINPVHNRSEFAGLDYETQAKKISEGYALLKGNGLDPKVFFAPSHTFDEVTIEALRQTTPIRFISDTIDYRPYKHNGVTLLPQQMGRCRKISLPGYWTFCLHPNNMESEEIAELDKFITDNRRQFMNFNELTAIRPAARQSLFGKLLNLLFRTKRALSRCISTDPVSADTCQ